MRLSMFNMPHYPPIAQLMGIIWGVTEDSAPIVGNLITSDCIVEPNVSNPQ